MTTHAAPRQSPAPVKTSPAPPRKRANGGKNTDRALAVLSPVLLLVLWEIGTRSGLLDERFFPAPTSIFGQMITMIQDGQLWEHTGASIQRLFLGFWLGVIPALVIGIVMGLSRRFRAALSPLISGTYPIPKSALLPLILLVFGLGEMSKVAMVAIGVFYPVVLNTVSGVLQIQPIYYDVARNFGASRWRVFRTVALPGALPSIMTGVELGAGLGLILIALAEMVGAESGLGFMIWNAWELFQVEQMYVGIMVIAVIGFAVALLVKEIARLLMPWARS
ncbi:taurine ABC transporter permease [Prauserella marina]|uniref:NitT/TauT family transport system permease protein n=1 Tax=Prauserella marina TaxID=530584 RepID=A0A222VS71_9PSEU|nr:ABC transporter permease [Prauserella marina]ASR36571.1 taurine ABC transporter permease [Prauserella marina]PWV73976.1 NitT/TauT family transport system permease protein [Prauserella marina]SDD60168.1 NitT/TauT family transport system permease protein [Prauserella marina]